MLRVALGAASSGAPRAPAMKSGTGRNGRAVRPAGFTVVATMLSAVMAMEAATLLVLLLVYRSNFCAWLYPLPRLSAAVNDRRPGPPGARVFERGIDGENGVVPSKGTASPPSFSPFRRFSSPRLVAGTLYDHTRNPPMLAETHYFRRAGRAITVGISTFGVASPKALNCSGFRNITEHCAQA